MTTIAIIAVALTCWTILAYQRVSRDLAAGRVLLNQALADGRRRELQVHELQRVASEMREDWTYVEQLLNDHGLENSVALAPKSVNFKYGQIPPTYTVEVVPRRTLEPLTTDTAPLNRARHHREILIERLETAVTTDVDTLATALHLRIGHGSQSCLFVNRGAFERIGLHPREMRILVETFARQLVSALRQPSQNGGTAARSALRP